MYLQNALWVFFRLNRSRLCNCTSVSTGIHLLLIIVSFSGTKTMARFWNIRAIWQCPWHSLKGRVPFPTTSCPCSQLGAHGLWTASLQLLGCPLGWRPPAYLAAISHAAPLQLSGRWLGGESRGSTLAWGEHPQMTSLLHCFGDHWKTQWFGICCSAQYPSQMNDLAATNPVWWKLEVGMLFSK